MTRNANDQERTADRANLDDVLTALRAGGWSVPCMDLTPAESAELVSDDEDAQREAARVCDTCDAAAPCRAYGLLWPKELGVYGGRTSRQRRDDAQRATQDAQRLEVAS